MSPIGPNVNPGTIRPETWKQKQGRTRRLPVSSRFPVKPSARRAGDSGCIASACGSKHPGNYNCYDGQGNNGGCGCSDKRSGTCMKGGGAARVYTDAEIMADIRRSGRRVPMSLVPQKAKLRRRRGRNFSGMNPVQQRPIGVNPSQGGFFAVPQDERNFGQQSALPYEEQLNFSHSNASGCGYSNMNHMNMNHSNFGANTASTTWSGSQTNVGPQDRIFAGNYANGRRRR